MKLFYRILSAILLPAFFIGVIQFWYNTFSYRDNGFKRLYRNSSLIARQYYHSKEELFGIAGIHNHNLFVSCMVPNLFLVQSPDGTVTEKVLPVKYLTKPSNMSLDYPDLYVQNASARVIYEFNLLSGRITQHFIGGSLFTRYCIPAGSKSIFLRQFKTRSRDEIFFKRNLTGSDSITSASLQPFYHDGGVLTDGQILYDPSTCKIIYVFYHKGGFLSIDTNLSSVHEYNTIDTFRNFHHIQFKWTLGNSFFKGMEDFISINQACYTADGKLYISSSVKADNESIHSYCNNIDVDVYSLKSGAYIGSFLLPRFQGERIKAMGVYGSNLVALYPHSILHFPLPVY